MKKRFTIFSIFCLIVLFATATANAGRDTTPPVTTVSPVEGTFTNSVRVTLSVNETATTYYTTNGSTPTTSSTKYSGSLTFTRTTTLKYFSVDKFRNAETVKTQTYTISTADTTPPVTSASPAGGTFTGPVTVTLTRNEPGTTYYCTGSATCSPTTVYTSPLAFSATTTLRFYSRDTAGNTESTKTQTYTISTQTGNHSGLTWTGYTMCQQCHATEVNEVLGSTHYQWKGSAAEMVNGPTQQGKMADMASPSQSAINAYCINTLGNWSGCSSCHVGLGAQPTAINKDNIDCLLCHQKDYKRVKVNGVFQPDTANMTISMDQAVRTLHRPVRANCLQCHAKAGGGDAVKRGDLALATANTTDTAYDRHMATTGSNLVCQQCHTFTQHRVAGRGSDLRPVDSTTSVSCSTSTCHATKMNSTGHTTTAVNRHVNRLACQTCHIPTYAKNAGDSTATEATETHRDWTIPEWNTTMNRWEPRPTKANSLKPVYKHWNGTSWGYNLKDPAVFDSSTGAYQISRPMGSIADTSTATKLYPFKYKTARQPYAASLNVLVAIDTARYWSMPASPYVPTTADINAAVQAGLTNMGYSATTQFSWVTTDEYQLINHQVPPRANALQCTNCHVSGSASQMNLKNLGYALKSANPCQQCHNSRTYSSSYNNFIDVHSRHVDSQNRDCTTCHSFSRPER